MANAQILRISNLAWRDYWHEWPMSLCFILALAAVLAPLLVLFGLKFGLVNSMITPLIENPHNREIRPVGSAHYNPLWFDAMIKREDVAFIVPKTRSIAAVIGVHNPKAEKMQIIRVEMIPSAAGDPLLVKATPDEDNPLNVVLSNSAGEKLKAKVGDEIVGSLTRTFKGKRERVTLKLNVVDIVSQAKFGREGMFVSRALLDATEDFRDGRAVERFGWSGNTDPHNRIYAGFRLYTATIDQVAGLRDAMAVHGIEMRTKAAEIDIVKRLDRNLSILYWLIASVAIVGFTLSLGASLWANVDRKQRDLSVLRLIGFHTSGIVSFPILQSIFTGILGCLLASGIYIGIQTTVNDMFSAHMEINQRICQLLPEHYAIALIFTIITAIFAASLGGYKAATLDAALGLREV